MKNLLGSTAFASILLLCIIAAAGLSGCSTVGGGPVKDTLRINLGTEPPSLDWHRSTDTTSFDVISNIMIGLSQYTAKLTCDPGIASKWDVEDGGKRYVFHINPNARWSDGKPVTAYDFDWAWERLLNPETGAEYASFLYDVVGAKEYNTKQLTDRTKLGFHAVDEKTFVVQLKRPAAYFIYLTAFAPTYPMRKDVVEKFGDRWTEPENIVTAGPFVLKSWQHEYKIELDSNPQFVYGEPKLKHIRMFMVPEQSTAFALYENNELDYIDNRSFSTPDVERFRNSPEYHNFALLRNTYLGFNTTKKPFTDPRVRLAFSMAIDRSVFPRILRRGEKPLFTWIPPALPGYSADSAVKFDIPKARQLLKEAGYPEGKGLPPIDFYYPNREDVRLIVEAVQDQLKRNLGVRVSLQNMEWKVYLQTLNQDAPPVYRGTWGADFPDPETFGNLFTSTNGNNDTKWKNAEYDRLIEQAEGEQEPAKRYALYAQADKLLCTVEAPIAPIFSATQNIMIKPWVNGIAMNPLDLQFFQNVTISEQ